MVKGPFDRIAGRVLVTAGRSLPLLRGGQGTARPARISSGIVAIDMNDRLVARPVRSLSDPRGCRQSAPLVQRHQRAASSSETGWVGDTNSADAPCRSAWVRYPVAVTKAANWRLVTSCASMRNAATRTGRPGRYHHPRPASPCPPARRRSRRPQGNAATMAPVVRQDRPMRERDQQGGTGPHGRAAGAGAVSAAAWAGSGTTPLVLA